VTSRSFSGGRLSERIGSGSGGRDGIFRQNPLPEPSETPVW
jgi:hypothetical protein